MLLELDDTGFREALRILNDLPPSQRRNDLMYQVVAGWAGENITSAVTW